MDPLIRILYLEDDPADLELVQAKLEEAGLSIHITRVETRDEFDEALRQDEYDIILADYRLPMYDGMSALHLAQERCPDTPFIFVSGTMGEEAAIEGLTEGATDYVLKQNLLRLGSAVKRALNEAKNRRERKQAEKERATMERLYHRAQKLEAMGALAGGIAHDFNNIIGVIMGCAELSLLAVSEEDPIYQYLKHITNAVRRASDLVQQILTFSRQKDSEKKALQISTMIKEVLKMLRASLPTTIEIKQNIDSESGTVLVDATQIHQVLINLCTNAAHAMRENGGVLEIMLANVDLTFDDVKKYVDIKPGAYVKLTVRDTGIGMDPNIIESIFDPYFTTKKEGEGTGLGLAVVHGIISQYGGAIEVQSEPGRGTAFHILIPRIDHETEMDPKKEIGELPKGTETILFIDDDKFLVEMAQKMLKYLGYQVVSSTSSIEALKLFKEGPDRFDLVITDMTMPHMTGDKLSGEILRIRPDIPIILCTGFSEMISEDKAKAMGIREYILKPLIMDRLAEKVRKVLDHRIDD